MVGSPQSQVSPEIAPLASDLLLTLPALRRKDLEER
jgi:hypothetical protein